MDTQIIRDTRRYLDRIDAEQDAAAAGRLNPAEAALFLRNLAKRWAEMESGVR